MKQCHMDSNGQELEKYRHRTNFVNGTYQVTAYRCNADMYSEMLQCLYHSLGLLTAVGTVIVSIRPC